MLSIGVGKEEKKHTVLFIQLVFGKQLLCTVLSAGVWYYEWDRETPVSHEPYILTGWDRKQQQQKATNNVIWDHLHLEL